MPSLTVRLGNLKLENPIIISSGHITRTAENIKKADRYGAGAVVIKTSLLEEEYNQVVKPYKPGKFPDVRAGFASAGDGLLAMCGLAPDPVETWVEWIRKNKKNLKTPLIASITAISIDGYVKGAKMFEESGADGLEIALSCPISYLEPYDYSGNVGVYAHKVEEICTAVRRAVSFPLGVKLQLIPLLSDTSPLKILQKVGVDYAIFSGGIPGGAPGIDLEKLEPEIPCSLGVSGSHVAKHIMFSGLLKASDMKDELPISASGGCQTWEDIVETILYGATAVSIHTLFMRKGFGIIKSLKEGIEGFMKEKGFETIDEMRGIICSKLLSEGECFKVYEPSRGKLAVSFDKEKCNGCGMCEETCFSYAIKMERNIPEIDQEKCEACRVCVCNCPEGALILDSTPVLRKMARQ